MPAKSKKPRTIAETITAALKRGKTNAEVLARVKKDHPHADTSLATVNWYRNRLRQAGTKLPTDREARRKKG